MKTLRPSLFSFPFIFSFLTGRLLVLSWIFAFYRPSPLVGPWPCIRHLVNCFRKDRGPPIPLSLSILTRPLWSHSWASNKIPPRRFIRYSVSWHPRCNLARITISSREELKAFLLSIYLFGPLRLYMSWAMTVSPPLSWISNPEVLACNREIFKGEVVFGSHDGCSTTNDENASSKS